MKTRREFGIEEMKNERCGGEKAVSIFFFNGFGTMSHTGGSCELELNSFFPVTRILR